MEVNMKKNRWSIYDSNNKLLSVFKTYEDAHAKLKQLESKNNKHYYIVCECVEVDYE